ncbi:MAG: CDP-diacylglycerol--serine O-phosphatidyltransferase [Nitrospiraceae bacterium]|nr:CDP-diacylglycerol--serine O-phosphatidyltransferase [Nitrospiraceae bacterium]
MKKGIYILPNAFTLMGMFSGFLAIIYAINGNFSVAAWAVMVAMVFDGVDGFVARLTGSATRFGIELDSLSDLVAFGVAPAIMIFEISIKAFGRLGWLAAFAYAACGALRLARYNVQMVTTERKSFMGLPIPGAAVILSTLVLFADKLQLNLYDNKLVLVLTYVLAGFMVSTLRFHGLKELNIKGRKPFWLLVAIVVVIVVVAVYPEIALFCFAMLYLMVGIVENIILLAHKKGAHRQEANLK